MAKYKIDNMDAPIDFQETDIVKRALQNAKNLLMCRMGEVPYGRYVGFNPALYDMPLSLFKNELMPELDRIMIVEPDIEVVDADAKLLDDGNIYIVVTVECLIDKGE